MRCPVKKADITSLSNTDIRISKSGSIALFGKTFLFIMVILN